MSFDIRFVKNEEIEKVRELYTEVFEDSEKFVEYFFSEEMDVTRVAGCFEGDELVSMIMLRDKVVLIDKKEKKACYLYAIATKENMRNKGCMKLVMDFVLKMAYGNPYEFIYMVPVNEKIYEKFGFKMLKTAQKTELKGIKAEQDCLIAKAGGINAAGLGEFAESVENIRKSGVVQKKDQLYFEKRILQAEAEECGVYIIRDIFDISPKAVVITGTDMDNKKCIADVICPYDDKEKYAILLSDAIADVMPYIRELPVMYYDKTNSMKNIGRMGIRLNDEI